MAVTTALKTNSPFSWRVNILPPLILLIFCAQFDTLVVPEIWNMTAEWWLFPFTRLNSKIIIHSFLWMWLYSLLSYSDYFLQFCFLLLITTLINVFDRIRFLFNAYFSWLIIPLEKGQPCILVRFIPDSIPIISSYGYILDYSPTNA